MTHYRRKERDKKAQQCSSLNLLPSAEGVKLIISYSLTGTTINILFLKVTSEDTVKII